MPWWAPLDYVQDIYEIENEIAGVRTNTAPAVSSSVAAAPVAAAATATATTLTAQTMLASASPDDIAATVMHTDSTYPTVKDVHEVSALSQRTYPLGSEWGSLSLAADELKQLNIGQTCIKLPILHSHEYSQ